jgi:LuxR family maltose regulon positive regulatory protein
METSILERFDAALCAALTGRSDCQDLLESLDQANLFLVPLDEERRWYRYHHLFADMLRHQLQKRAPGRAEALHAGASRWFEAHGASVEAIAHALKAQDYGWAADLVVSAEDLLRRGEIMTLVTALKALPEDCYHQRADLNFLLAWALFPSGQAELLKLCLRRAEPVAQPGDAPRLLAVKSFIARIEGDFESAVDFARQALGGLSVEDWMWTSGVALTLASCLQLGDRLDEAEEAYDRAIAAFLRQGDSFFGVMAQGLKGGLLLERGRLAEAHALLSETLRRAEARAGRGWPPISYVLSALAGVLAHWGRFDEALPLAEAGLAAGEGFVEPSVNSLHVLAAIRLRARHGEAAEAAALAERAGTVASRYRVTYLDGVMEVQRALHAGTPGRKDREVMQAWERAMGPRLLGGRPHWPLRDGRLLLAKLQLAMERPADGIALLERVEADALRAGRMPLVIAARASLALALDTAGERERALSLLEAALSAAEPEGVLAPFLEEGAPMQRLLDVWLRRGARTAVLEAFARRLLPEPADDGGLVEPLSAREREVLALIAEGMSNQAIADRLGIELSTVKRHGSNLLGKLGASNRTQAVAMGRRHGWF